MPNWKKVIVSGSSPELHNITANQFVKSGGTSAQFLKANGSVDSSTYLTSLGGAILTTGNQTATGNKTFSGRIDADDSLNMGDDAVIAFDQGTVSAPGIGIAQEPTTGFYKEAGGSNLCISLAGSKIMRYDATHVELNQELKLSDLNASTVDTDKFLVAASDGDVEYRTGAEVLSDIGISSVGSGTIISTSERNAISSNTNNVLTNTSNISTNTSNISTNTSNISTNTSNISGKAASGANNDITSLSGLTTVLSVAQGGTGVNSLDNIQLSSFDDDLSYIALSGNQSASGTKTFTGQIVIGANGSTSAPMIRFPGTSTNTGFYASNPDEISITRAGVQSFKFDSNGFQSLLSGTSQFSGHLQAHCLGIGGTPSTTSGEIWAYGDIVANKSSDRRLKKYIKNIPNALEKVSKINGVSFEWKKTDDKMKREIHSHEGHDIGVIAQEVEEVLPEIVSTRDNGYKAVYYEKLVPLLIEAIKELKAEVDELKKSK